VQVYRYNQLPGRSASIADTLNRLLPRERHIKPERMCNLTDLVKPPGTSLLSLDMTPRRFACGVFLLPISDPIVNVHETTNHNSRRVVLHLIFYSSFLFIQISLPLLESHLAAIF
jgi:hypothetical protein